MKLNLKKLKMNQIILILALILVVIWMVRMARVRVELNEGAKSKALVYAESTDEPTLCFSMGWSRSKQMMKRNRRRPDPCDPEEVR